MKKMILVLLVAMPLFAARLERANVVERNATNFANEMRQLVASPTPVWISWDAPSNEPEASMCCFSSIDAGEKSSWRGGKCSLSNRKGAAGINIGSVKGQPPAAHDTFAVFVRASKGEVHEIRMFSEDCVVDADGATITHLKNVPVTESIAWLERVAPSENHAIPTIAMHRAPQAVDALERLVRAGEEQAAFWLGHKGGSRGRRILRDVLDQAGSHHMVDQAIAGISQDEDREATDLLLSLAKTHRSPQVRKQAIFWLGQRAGAKATAHLREAADDPNSDVREMAVFAISQLPKDQAIPELIKLARTHKSKTVRERSIFWLGQSGDPRALDFIEEILTK